MQKANPISHLGTATYAATRAADIVGIFQDKSLRDDTAILERLNICLKEYGENGNVTSSDLVTFGKVADRLYDVFASGSPTQAANLLNTILAKHAQAPRLTNHGESPWHLHVDSDDHASWAEWFAASSALALATLLAEKQRNPGGVCLSATCKKPFIDLGKGGGRSYCSPRCASRERVAAYRKTKKA